MLILEDFDGISLNRILAKDWLNIETSLNIAQEVVERLETLHKRQLVYKNINPSNIIWNRKSGQVKLNEHALASVPLTARSVHPELEYTVGSLTYISPEQTGRIYRQLDYRSDFYSLGAVLYEMVVGKPPFVSTDAMELVHAHIAKEPVPPAVLDPEIPSAVSAVILRLLSKAAEERYQSIFGLQYDLTVCLQLIQSGEIGDERYPAQTGCRRSGLCKYRCNGVDSCPYRRPASSAT